MNEKRRSAILTVDGCAHLHELPSYSDVLKMLEAVTFAAETAAHLRGLEREILPTTDKARELIARVKG